MGDAIDADADDHGKPSRWQPLAFDQDAGDLQPIEQQIVRPFQRQTLRDGRTGQVEDRLMQRQRRDEGNGGSDFGRRRIDQQERRGEIARLRCPSHGRGGRARGLLPAVTHSPPGSPARAAASARALVDGRLS